MPKQVTAEVSASALPSDVVGAIVDSAIENKKREKETWLTKTLAPSWGKAGVALLLFLCLSVVFLMASPTSMEPEDGHNDITHEADYFLLEKMHTDAGKRLEDPDKDFFGPGADEPVPGPIVYQTARAIRLFA